MFRTRSSLPESGWIVLLKLKRLPCSGMALLKAGDDAAGTSLIGPDEVTLQIGNGPADWYPGWQVTIAHLREALTSPAACRSCPGHLRDGPTGTSAGSLTR
jgi:hypothetical protein